jgi:PilZ domain-containing protein
MSSTEGRIEKRFRLRIPLELSKLQDPNRKERTVTENVSSIGARVLTLRAMQPNERLMVGFLELNLRTQARVVYCQRLPDEHFALGLQFQGMSISKWTKESFSGACEST